MAFVIGALLVGVVIMSVTGHFIEALLAVGAAILIDFAAKKGG